MVKSKDVCGWYERADLTFNVQVARSGRDRNFSLKLSFFGASLFVVDSMMTTKDVNREEWIQGS
jgi:hypothetical protein